MADPYSSAAIAEARARGLTSGQIAALGYTEIAALAGVTINGRGESAADFFYANVRKRTVVALAAEERTAADEDMRARTQANLRTSGDPNAVVMVDDEGRLVVTGRD